MITTDYNEIINKIDKINPIKYGKDRNYINGSVSRLSPYISRGVISPKYIYNFLINKGYTLMKIQKFVQELVWREYWQFIWMNNKIDKDLKNTQNDVLQYGIPFSILNHSTKIKAIDNAIKELYREGYIHNHLRMYIASVTTNIAKYHWRIPAKWMYNHLLDADWGSNALSWQWVCGSNSNKKYYANQDNINRFTNTFQKDTILDHSYEELIKMKQPLSFVENTLLKLKTNLPLKNNFIKNDDKPMCIYNFYNLDVKWREKINAHRVLLIEPSIFTKYPISKKSLEFMIELSKNISNIKIFVGEFKELPIGNSKVYFKEHPLNYNYKGTEDSREWLCFPSTKFKSFFKHWNYVVRQLLA
tara:strand:+ start:415 stop:1491 length:1077 start_codon:yes stop_codon:yes gene_type:complete